MRTISPAGAAASTSSNRMVSGPPSWRTTQAFTRGRLQQGGGGQRREAVARSLTPKSRLDPPEGGVTGTLHPLPRAHDITQTCAVALGAGWRRQGASRACLRSSGSLLPWTVQWTYDFERPA